MAYITQYNFKRISNLLDAKKIINKDNIDSILLCEDLPAIKFGYLNKIEKQNHRKWFIMLLLFPLIYTISVLFSGVETKSKIF